MRFGLAILLSLAAMTGAALAQEPGVGSDAQGRVAFPDGILLDLSGGTDDAAIPFDPGPEAISGPEAGGYISGGLAISLELALSERWGFAGALDWQRTQSDEGGDGAWAPTSDSFLASGQISFEF